MSATESTGYEFARDENTVVDENARWLRLLAVFMCVGAVGKLVAGRPVDIALALLDVGVAALMFKASGAFMKVVDTQGDDVAHLMRAIDSMGRVLVIRSVTVLLGVALALAGMGLDAGGMP